MENKKGFTLTELLAVIVILGILMVGSIVAVSKLKERAKKNSIESEKKTLEMATRTFAEENNALPKAVGERVDIKASTLKETNYLKEDIVNGSKKSCMKDSFVRIYRAEKNKYKYTVYLYCEGDTIPEENINYPEINVEIGYPNTTIEINGNSEKTLGITGYSYIVSAIYKNSVNEADNLIEVYRSEFFRGNNEKTISKTIDLQRYVIKTKITKFIVRAEAYNEAGGYNLKESEISQAILPVTPETPDPTPNPNPGIPGQDISFKIGDYFTLVPDASTYDITSDLTYCRPEITRPYGCPNPQTIKPNELTLWRVISLSNGVEGVSEYVTSTDVYLYGDNGYLNAINNLQVIASQYAKAGYTSKTRIMGYNGQTLKVNYDIAQYEGTTAKNYKLPPYGPEQEYEGGVIGDTLYYKDYLLVSNVYKTDSATYGSTGLKAYRVGTTTPTSYWLASREYSSSDVEGNHTYWEFGLRAINIEGNHMGEYICEQTNQWRCTANYYNALRPIITLDSSVRISGGSGTKTDPYILTK